MGCIKDLDFISVELRFKPTDIKPTRNKLGMQCDVETNNSQTSITKVQQLEKDALGWFPDGSKMDAGASVRETGSTFKLSNP